MRLAGHCIKHTTEIAHNLVLWEPTCGKTNRGRKPVTYIDCLKEDTGWNEMNGKNVSSEIELALDLSKFFHRTHPLAASVVSKSK